MPPHDKTNKMTCAPSEVSDQPRHQPGQIRDFAVRSVIVTKWIKSCLLQCFGTFKMPILMFISVLVFRPEGQIWNPVRRDTRIYVRRILNAFSINKNSVEFFHDKSEL